MSVSNGNLSHFETIDEFCALWGMTNCSCDDNRTEIIGILESFGFCTGQPAKSIYIYEPDLSRSYAGIIVLITLCGILGNAMVVIVAAKNWKTSIAYQKLIGQLGLSDLLFATLHLITVVHLFWTNKWIYGETVCKILEGSITLGSLFAVGLILIISIERYIAIVHPFFWKYGTTKLNYLLSVVNICVGIATIVPRFLYLHLDEQDTCTDAWHSSRDELIYELYIVVVYFCVPLVAMFYLNVHILYSLRRNVMGSTDCLREGGAAQKKNRRIMRILISIIVAFTVLVMPNRVIVLYFLYVKHMELPAVGGDHYTVLTFLALVPYSFHVTINPILYCVIDNAWRKQALDILCFRWFNDKYRRNSIDGSNVNSFDTRFSRVKSNSFLHENRVNHFSLAERTPSPSLRGIAVNDPYKNNTNGYLAVGGSCHGDYDRAEDIYDSHSNSSINNDKSNSNNNNDDYINNNNVNISNNNDDNSNDNDDYSYNNDDDNNYNNSNDNNDNDNNKDNNKENDDTDGSYKNNAICGTDDEPLLDMDPNRETCL